MDGGEKALISSSLHSIPYFFSRLPLVTDPERNVYSSQEGPFLYISQFRLATHLVLMEMETFNILAQSLHHKDINLVLLANTGRSGSTLLAQIFESVEG